MTDIKLGFVISLSLHFLFFLSLAIFSQTSSRIYYIPIQVIGSTSYGASAAAQPKAEQKTKAEVLKPGDIAVGRPIIKKKKLAENKSEETTPEKSSETAGAAPGGISVEASNFPYIGYVNTLRNKVAQNWNPSPFPSSSPKKVLVYFRIHRDGRVDNMAVKESAGISYVDRSAIRAIMSSAPFPPLPPGYTDSYLGVYFMFELSGK